MNMKRSGKNNSFWNFIDENGTFSANNPHKIRGLYFPLANESGIMSSVSPSLNGDIKTGQNHFLTVPVSLEDLHNTKSSRNFWIDISGEGLWSLCGCDYSGEKHKKDNVKIEAGHFWHRLIRENKSIGIKASITNFVPASDDTIEIMFVEVENTSEKTLQVKPSAGIPIYGRSADNLRDHRHVTSLLNRIFVDKFGVIVKPAMSFDERGHVHNSTSYFVLGCDGTSNAPVKIIPTVEDFIGEGGDFYNPESLAREVGSSSGKCASKDGKEAFGGLLFKEQKLSPGKTMQFILVLGIGDDFKKIKSSFNKFNSLEKVRIALELNKKSWAEKINRISFSTGDSDFNLWCKWVVAQPILRKLFGCSFLPDFDYGKGGRGWRDLWQDCLALILISPKSVREMLINNFGGVRIDGSNATIIGKNPGEFIADRNNIIRVWMDHGFWPFITLGLYINQTGDYDVLFEDVEYFCDKHNKRGKGVFEVWNEKYGTKLKTVKGDIYRGSVLEHVIVQNLVQFFNVGKHNNILLEGADWNDGLDMAQNKGESVAFTHSYAYNLKLLCEMLRQLLDRGEDSIDLLGEVVILLDTIKNKSANYKNPSYRRDVLEKYFRSLESGVLGVKKRIKIADLIGDLERKFDFIVEHLRKREWIRLNDHEGFFNGYYDDNSKRVEGKIADKTRMTLTGQVFAIMGGIAKDKQIDMIIRSVEKYLMDKDSGNVRLNTDFGADMFNFGRAFSFAYGEKENGAFFSHMAVMYSNALYKKGRVKEGFRVLDGIYKMSTSSFSNIYPCVPEYFNNHRRGRYSYLTGSASWYVLTLLTEAFGVRGFKGDLCLEPKLLLEQFNPDMQASVETFFADRKINVIYKNPEKLEYGQYGIKEVCINGKKVEFLKSERGCVVISLDKFLEYSNKTQNVVDVTLSKK